MNKSPLNYLITIALGALLWVVFGILLSAYFSESPSLAEKDPADLATELRAVFGAAALLSVVFSCYWYSYGNKASTVGNLPAAKKKWITLFVFQVVIAVALVVAVVVMNSSEGIESNWFLAYFGVLALLSFVLFWLTTYLMSPRTVKYIPFGK